MEGKEVLFIDDFDNEWSGKAVLKKWGDRYSFPAEHKEGHHKRVNFKFVIVISNTSIDESGFWPGCVPGMKTRIMEVTADIFKTKYPMVKQVMGIQDHTELMVNKTVL